MFSFVTGDTGITAAASDTITGFTSGSDKLQLNMGGAVQLATSSTAAADYDTARAIADTLLSGPANVAFVANSTTDNGGFLFLDRDNNGAADEGIVLNGGTVTVATGDIS